MDLINLNTIKEGFRWQKISTHLAAYTILYWWRLPSVSPAKTNSMLVVDKAIDGFSGVV